MPELITKKYLSRAAGPKPSRHGEEKMSEDLKTRIGDGVLQRYDNPEWQRFVGAMDVWAHALDAKFGGGISLFVFKQNIEGVEPLIDPWLGPARTLLLGSYRWRGVNLATVRFNPAAPYDQSAAITWGEGRGRNDKGIGRWWRHLPYPKWFNCAMEDTIDRHLEQLLKMRELVDPDGTAAISAAFARVQVGIQ